MLEADKQMRFANSCADAALGYAAAATAAYGALANQMIEMWKQVLPPAPEPEPTSWYRHPDLPKRGETPFALLPWAPFLAAAQAPGMQLALPFGQSAANPYLALMNTWTAAPAAMLDFWGMNRAPIAWPMAFMMMAAGFPRSVAVPTAEANAAVLDAAGLAGEALQNVYARYRSDGGHAAAHVIYARERVGPALGLMAFAVAPIAWPWLSAALPRAVA